MINEIMKVNPLNSGQYDTSVIIPVLNAAKYLPNLFSAIQSQKPYGPKEIILVDSKSTDETIAVASRYQNVRVIEIDNFSHGRSRNLGAKHARGQFVVFLTQDALPKDNEWLFKLLEPFEDKEVAATYSRQIPRSDALFTERFFLKTRFPNTIPVKRKLENGEDELTLERVFFSNVSSAVRRSILLQYPFDETLIMSEDQQLSRDLLSAGYAVVYASKSIVIHSHNYTLKNVFKRYFDSVYSLTELFPKHGLKTSAKMGISYLRKEFIYVMKKHPFKLGFYFLYITAKTAGTLFGHFAKIMPLFILRRISMHNYHWK